MGDEALLQKARNSPYDWTPNQVVKLLEGFDFECWQGRQHTICRHKAKPEVYLPIPRHRRIRAYIVRAAVKLIDGTRLERGQP